MLHLDSPLAVAPRGRFIDGTMMPQEREESIPSCVRFSECNVLHLVEYEAGFKTERLERIS